MNESRFTALGIGFMVVAVLVFLPFMIAVSFYTFASIQAIITGLGFSSETLNIPLFLIMLVGTVTLFVVVLHAIVAMVGRSFSPKRKRDRDALETEATR